MAIKLAFLSFLTV